MSKAIKLRYPCNDGHVGPYVPMPHMTEWLQRECDRMHLDLVVPAQVRCMACLSDTADPRPEAERRAA
jgi:hypothetical protein